MVALCAEVLEPAPNFLSVLTSPIALALLTPKADLGTAPGRATEERPTLTVPQSWPVG